MIDRDHKLSITRQAQLLGMSRGAVYYLPQPTSPADLALMRQIPAGHPKLLHLWPVKLPQAGRSDYAYSAAMAMREAASFRR